MSKTKTSRKASLRGAPLVALLALLGATPALVLARGAVAYASTPVRPERVAEGKVENKAGVPINGAVVYLKNNNTHSVDSFICGQDGTFRFGQLSPTTDYSVWAQANGRKSKTRTVSSFDDKNDFYFTLNID